MKGKWFDGSTTTEPTSGDGNNARYLYFNGGSACMYNSSRAYGYSVRCVQE